MSSAALRLFAKQIAEASGRELGQEPRGLPESARLLAELGVEERRVPDHDLALRALRRVPLHHGGDLARELARQLAGVRDRRGGEQEPRLGVVDTGEPPQPSEHVRHVGAEDAAVHVGLVHDDVTEVVQHVSAVVVGEHAHVEHVRVREDRVRPLADLPACLRRRVAVVDRRLEPLQPQLGETAGLVLREGLRRVEVERPGLRLARSRRARAG